MPFLRISMITLVFSCGLAAQQPQAVTHAPDGGVRRMLESLTVPATPNAPFSATVTTEWTTILVDGSKQTSWNHRLIARDSSGRVFQERRYFMPDGDKVTTPLNEVDYVDPNRHEIEVCRPQPKVCYERSYREPPATKPMASGALPGGRGSVKEESLGHRSIDGVDAEGSREITTLNAGVDGLEREEPVVKEFWYSERLGLNVVTKRFDPRSGAQNIILSGISQSEPDPKLFVVPEGYRIVKMEP
ncbi:MAG: hypothetical protein PW789_18690 [Edaphobacter sp.]|uniref:hypothetical protein n=1 Tax=Edaphobacter sp. TaxID=1934404 RepID=UPI0023A72A60|nr:hypothetical protein [Edaphobacter sp.]MDE1178607.1 hypothetical protein [Edaphobacter sp.]